MILAIILYLLVMGLVCYVVTALLKKISNEADLGQRLFLLFLAFVFAFMGGLATLTGIVALWVRFMSA
jgi:hypothetical protein